jgi:hypothetical protein
MNTSAKRLSVVATGVIAAVLAVGGVASASVLFLAGSGINTPRDITSDVAWNAPATAIWTDVPSTAISVSVPTGTVRRIRSTFQAESQCTAASWCSARVVAVESDGTVTELAPVAGTDFAFDSPGDSWESHSMLRSSPWLPADTYVVKVQVQMVGPAAGADFRLDDYTHRVDLVTP